MRVLGAVLAGGIALAGCSDGHDAGRSGDRSAAGGDGSDTTAAPPAKAEVTTVTGNLAPDARDVLADAVGTAVDEWLAKTYSVDPAEAARRSVSLDVLAVKQRPVGVTATIDMSFDAAGAQGAPQQLAGTLDLTPDGGAWKVFGFDISSPPAAAAPASPTETSESGS